MTISRRILFDPASPLPLHCCTGVPIALCEELLVSSRSLNFGKISFRASTSLLPARLAMFAQSGQYRTGGQSGLFSTPQQSSPFAQSSSYNPNSAPPGAAASSSAFGGTGSTFAGPQFGGGNHGAAFGASGQFGGSTAGGHQSTGTGGAYGSPYGAGGAGATSMQGSSGVMGATPGTKRTYLPGYLSGGAAAQASPSLLSLHLARADGILDTDSTPSRHLRTTQTTERGTRRRGRRPCPARQSLATAAAACLAANQGAPLNSSKHETRP